MRLEDVMSKPVFIDKSATLSNALDLMEERDTRRLLVVRDGVVEGVLTLRNIMRELGSRRHGNVSASSLRVATAISDAIELRSPDTELEDVLGRFDEVYVIVVGNSMEKDDIVGWVRPVDVIPHLRIENKFAGNVMKRDPLTFTPHERVVHARRLMLERDVGRAPVVDEGRLVGLLSEREIARAEREIREDLSSSQQENRFRTMIVEDIMTVNPKFVYTNDSIERVTELMREGYGGLPVLNLDEEVVGMIARRDIIRAAINDREHSE